MKDDEHWMRRALRLAEKGRGRTSPNPMVGAVLVRDGRIVGEGYHVRAGELHAEINALQQAGTEARGATLYINLEPCSHYGKTPPCAPALIQAGIKRAVLGMEDPNPMVKGRGLEILQTAGLQVEVGILEEACQKLNEAFCKFIRTKEPLVILKIAATMDGKIATQHGESKWITREKSRRLVQHLRNQADGILVGLGTILKDDPQLTVRIRGGKNPYRIVLDSHLRIPEKAKIIDRNPEKTIIATTELASKEKLECLERKGVQVMFFDSKQGRINLRSLLSKLGGMGMMSLLVEGGSQVNGSFLDERLIDKIFLFLSPRLLGGSALEMFGGRGVGKLEEALSLNLVKIKKVGDDILFEGYPKKLCSQES